jgi:2-methylcitrate dehydratase PrpD
MGLDERRTAHALAISLNLIAGTSGRFRTGLSPRWLLHATGVTNGSLAARAAAAGFEGDLALLDRDWLAESHGVAFLPATMLAMLDKPPYGQLSMKPYPSAKQAIAAIEALRALVAEGLRPSAITALRVNVPSAYQRMIDSKADPANRATTFSSVRYQMALALFAPRALDDVAREQMPWTPEMAAFMDKVTVTADGKLDDAYPRRWPAEVTVETAAGTMTRRLMAPLGDPETALDDGALADKARRMLSPAFDAAEIDGWLRAAREALSPAHAGRALKLLAQLALPNMERMEKVS